MSFFDLVQKRQSTRTYIKVPVEREKIERCCEAARLAPSACNSQPWTFIIVDEPEKRQMLAHAAFSGMYSVFNFAQEASVLIVVIVEKSRYVAALAGKIRKVHYNLIDVGIASEHFVLQATEEGLDTCLIGWFNEKRVKKVLSLSPNTEIALMLSVGYAPEHIMRTKKRKPLNEIRKYY